MGLTGSRLASLVAAALVGGYALATAVGIFFGGVLPMSRGEAALVGNLLSFAAYVGAVIWTFVVRRPVRVWLGLIIPSCVLTAGGLLLAGRVA
jgi:hypothetical protein